VNKRENIANVFVIEQIRLSRAKNERSDKKKKRFLKIPIHINAKGFKLNGYDEIHIVFW